MLAFSVYMWTRLEGRQYRLKFTCECLHLYPTYRYINASIMGVTLGPSPVDAIHLSCSKYEDLLIGEQIDDYSIQEFSLRNPLIGGRMKR